VILYFGMSGPAIPRADFEAEREELARRFQVKYRSGDGRDSNVAPYFIGVFDTGWCYVDEVFLSRLSSVRFHAIIDDAPSP
jgi:hypothetical protein